MFQHAALSTDQRALTRKLLSDRSRVEIDIDAPGTLICALKAVQIGAIADLVWQLKQECRIRRTLGTEWLDDLMRVDSDRVHQDSCNERDVSAASRRLIAHRRGSLSHFWLARLDLPALVRQRSESAPKDPLQNRLREGHE